MRLSIILAVAMIIGSVSAQERFSTGDLKGFTKAPSEGIVHISTAPICVQTLDGSVARSVGDRSPIADALVEFRGPRNRQNIRATRTDSRGHFTLPGAPAGTYKFKITALGFQSEVGTVTVTAKALPRSQLSVTMRPGI